MLRTGDEANLRTQPLLDARGGRLAKPVVDCRAQEVEVRWGWPEPWLLGPWRTDVIRNGVMLTPRGDWEEVCRYREGRIEHWEYERKLSHGVRLQRQITYLGRDGVLFLADAVLSSRRACWAVEVARGIGPAVLRTDGESPAGVSPGIAAAAWWMPLIPQEYFQPDADPRSPSPGMATWRGRWEGRALSLPFVLLAPGSAAGSEVERRSPPTWRNLTVTERAHVVSADTAVAYRVQLGSRQWVFYRSLAAPGNRAFLGCNFAGESLAGTFGKKGVTALLEVELEE